MTKSFSNVFLEPGDKILVVHRRLFESDKSRFFVGEVVGFNEANGLLKTTGHSFGETSLRHEWVRKKNVRTKIISLTSGTYIVYQLPPICNLDTVGMKFDKEMNLWLVDGDHFAMDLSESAHSRS